MIHERNGLKIQHYGNGSYAYWNAKTRAWNNIPKELAKALIGNAEFDRGYKCGFADGNQKDLQS